MTQTRKLTLITALVTIAVMALGWFLLISPKRGEAADLRDQTAAQDAANAQLQAKVAMLREQAKDLPKQRARLALIAVNIPDNPQLPSLIRSLTKTARDSRVDLQALQPGAPAAVASTVAGATTAPVRPGQPVAPVGLQQIPLAITITGDYFEAANFVNRLEGLRRSLLVTGLAITPVGAAAPGSTGGSTASPEVSDDIRLVVTGRVFTSRTLTAPPPATRPTAPPSTTPTGAAS